MKRANPGKEFERRFRDSIPDNVYQYRLRDCPGAWGGDGGGAVRFTPSNDYDLLMYKAPWMFALELKSEGGTSFRFDRIRKNQLKGLLYAHARGVISGIVIEWRKYGVVYFVDTEKIYTFSTESTKKSMSFNDCENLGLFLPTIPGDVALDISNLLNRRNVNVPTKN